MFSAQDDLVAESESCLLPSKLSSQSFSFQKPDPSVPWLRGVRQRDHEIEVTCPHETCLLQQSDFKAVSEVKRKDKHDRPCKGLDPMCHANPCLTFCGRLSIHQTEVYDMRPSKIPLSTSSCRRRRTGAEINREQNLEDHVDRGRPGAKATSPHINETFQSPPLTNLTSCNKLNDHTKDSDISNLSVQTAALLKQPTTRPISGPQLINEVNGIYAGLVMVEKKCVEIVAQQSQSTKRLSDQQWKALVALHRTLLQEHHDFFSASQHPTASDSLKKLAAKYTILARMWRHGIHAFLELLRHRLPDSIEHMLSFIYLAYSMMALLKESMPSFVETWIECLGDSARYRMAIEGLDPHARKIWSDVARKWYDEAADKSLNIGRIQHHLGVLARPNIVEQHLYYARPLAAVMSHCRDYEFPRIPLTPLSRATNNNQLDNFSQTFENCMDRSGARFKTQGPNIVLGIPAPRLDFENKRSFASRNDSRQENFDPEKFKPELTLSLKSKSTVYKIYARTRLCLQKFDVRLLAGLGFVQLFAGARAQDLASSMAPVPQGSQLLEDKDLAYVLLQWCSCVMLAAAIPIMGAEMQASNLKLTSSIVAFISALAMGIAKDQEFPNPLAALFGGLSAGFALLLLRLTYARRSLILVSVLRYVTPMVLLWQMLEKSELQDQTRPLDLKNSILCLCLLGSVGLNALINEQFRELAGFFHWVWEGFLTLFELERRTPQAEVPNEPVEQPSAERLRRFYYRMV